MTHTMNSAATRAAQALLGASRNRPSMSQGRTSSSGSGSNSGGNESVNTRESSCYAKYSDRTSGGGGSSDTGGPSFMQDLQSQYESLSDRLAREVSMSAAASINRSPSSGNSTNSNNNNKKGGGILKSSSARRVRWAETARIASTMDADRASAERDDDDVLLDRSPIDVLADLFQRKYTLPIFLVVTTAIFLLVHLAGGPNDDTFARYDSTRSGDGLPSKAQGLNPGENQQVIRGMFPGSMTRSGIVGESDIDNQSTFSLAPMAIDLESLAPTMAVIHHTTPKISPLLGISPSLFRAQSGNVGSEEDEWIVIETGSGKLGGEDREDEGDDELVLKTQAGWNYPPGDFLSSFIVFVPAHLLNPSVCRFYVIHYIRCSYSQSCTPCRDIFTWVDKCDK